MSRNGDMSLTCRQCGGEFAFTRSEQDFYELKGFGPPGRCRECRSATEHRTPHLTCTQCGVKLEKEAPIFCNTCLQNTQLAFERKASQAQKTAKTAQAKLTAAESRKAELEESLYQTEQLAAELEIKVSNLNRDLEKAQESYIASGWLKPLLESVEERLKALENTQRESDQRMFEVIHTLQKRYEDTSLLDIIKRSLVPYRGQGA